MSEKKFYIKAEIKADIEITIFANSLEDALARANKLKFEDFVEPKGAKYTYLDPKIKGAQQA